MNPNIRKSLSLLKQYHALTRNQLAYFNNTSIENMKNKLALENCGYFIVEKSIKPYIYRLSSKGARLVDCEPLRQPRLSGLMHTCHRNQALISLQQQYPEEGYQLLPKSKLWHTGLNPANNFEHVFVANGGRLALILIDDGGFTTRRIKTAWERKHKPHKTYDAAQRIADGKKMLSQWKELPIPCLIFTCENKVKRLENAAIKYGIERATVHPLIYLWDMI